MHQSLAFKEVCFTAPEFALCFLALANISINEKDAYLLGAKRNALCHNGNVKANTVFALPNGLQFNSFPRNKCILVLDSLNAQFLGDYQVGKPLSRNLFC